MSEIDNRGMYRFVAVLVPLAFLVTMTAFTGGDVIAEDGGDPIPPPEGDWNITGETVIDGIVLYVTGNINVGRDATLIITDSTIQVNSSRPDQFTMSVAKGASLIITGSTLRLDAFMSEPGSTLEMSGETVITTKGRLLARSSTILFDGVTINNIAPNVDSDEDGLDAICILDGNEASTCRNVTIRNTASSAGPTSPGMDGSRGGRSILISNVSTWTDSLIVCTAGRSRSGGLGLINGSGGSGAPGSDAQIILRANIMETVEILTYASDGGMGARGAGNPAGNGGDGGDGNSGGNATVHIESDAGLQFIDCDFLVVSGNGGSGGNGGEAIDGDGGNGGEGSHGGDALVEIGAVDDIHLEWTTIAVEAGEGGYGGDYGRLEGGTGTFGLTAPGGDGGTGSVYITSPGDLVAYDLTIEARGGSGLDGGGGYEQGETGGDGGDGVISVHAEVTLEAELVDLLAVGGNGGPGGPAFSDIRGKGGDGGDAYIEFTGKIKMDVEEFSIYVIAGEGGLGNKPIYDGAPGIPTLDVDTQLLHLSNGTLNMPLDDLSGDARAYLLNVLFDMEFGIQVLPIGDAIAWVTHKVTVLVVDDPDPVKAQPLVGWEVSVFRIDTGELVATCVTDENGLCYFDLASFEYTSLQVNYVGSYHFIASSPDGKTTKKVRGEVIAPTQIRVVVNRPWVRLIIEIETPEDGVEYHLFPSQGDHLDTNGFITCESYVTFVLVQLYPKGEDANAWPRYKLGLSPVPYEDLTDPDARWGKYFPPNEFSNKWLFFFGFLMADEDVEYYNGNWVYLVSASTPTDTRYTSVEFELLLDENLERPWVQVHTAVHGETFNGSIVAILGAAGDDFQLLLVQVRIDSGQWEAVSTAEDWSYNLDTGALDEGYHTIDFRSFDGLHYSNINASSFEVRLVGDPPVNDDGNGDWEWTTQLYLMAGGVILMVIAIALIVSIIIVRRRSPPDSSGEV